MRKTDLPEYSVWEAAVQRCTNPKQKLFRNYGGRGISIAPEWRNSFDAFFSHIGPRPSDKHSLDRIDNDKGYVPGNVRWATRHEQARNKTTNRLITAFGETKCLADWSAEKCIPLVTLHWRINRGWPVERALTTAAPGRGYGRRVVSDEQVADIRRQFARGKTRAELSRQYEVGYLVIHNIVLRKTYRHVAVNARAA